MRRNSTMLVGAVLLAAGVVGRGDFGFAQKGNSQTDAQPPVSAEVARDSAARRALSPDAAQAKAAIAELRAAGPDGLQALVTEHRGLIERALELTPLERSGHPEWQRYKVAVDRVGTQCDNWASRLYWYDDWEGAKQAAIASGKPILSLRLLGNLYDELSCANSRFFRTALYPNSEIGLYLRQHYVLHWQSVRPVPKVTVDFGDGRKLQTTITGNSIHYILTPEGDIIDALPGLYAPQVFLRWLQRSKNVFDGVKNDPEQRRLATLAEYHKLRRDQVAMAWRHDLDRIGVQLAFDESAPAPPAQRAEQTAVTAAAANAKPINMPASAAKPLRSNPPSAQRGGFFAVTPGGGLLAPDARRAAGVAVAKRAIEPLVNQIVVEVPRDTGVLKDAMDEDGWKKIAALYAKEATLDAGSLRVLQSKTSEEGRVEKMVAAFQKSIALDSVRNEYLLHTRIHEWLGAGYKNRDVAAFNQRVYAELFLTPDSDPWLGLLPAEGYTAVPNGGVIQ